MKINPCVIGLGYVGLPIILHLASKFSSHGFDINTNRINNLKNKIDTNNEFKSKDFYKKKIHFTNNLSDIKNCNFFIICVPTPVKKNKKPNLQNLKNAIDIVSKVLKKNDIIFIESTIYPGLTKQYKNYLEKKTNLKNNIDFYIGYSPERINPGDKTNTLKNIKKIVAINTEKKSVLKKVYKVYNTVSKEIILSKNIRAAETAKVIENIQRDLNIALINEILLICKKLKIDFKEVLKLAKTKWNFINFNPGLVGGHCLPVDPYYLSSIAEKKKFKTNVVLAGRKTNDKMSNFIINDLKFFLAKKNKSLKNSKIIIIGLSYKAGVADMRNSLNFEIFKKLKKNCNNVYGYDPFVENKIRKNYRIYNKINANKKYDVILFLSNHEKFKKKFKNILLSKNRNNILDPFRYFS
jgi:UDP-N-acetyl-D-galactosamine dehydrogenase